VGRFSTVLWQGIVDVFEAIIRHPFVRGLTDGSLSLEANSRKNLATKDTPTGLVGMGIALQRQILLGHSQQRQPGRWLNS